LAKTQPPLRAPAWGDFCAAEKRRGAQVPAGTARR